MKIATCLAATVLSVFSTSVISYVALATPIGPWMGPTLALFVVVLFPFFFSSKQEMFFAILAGSMGGIMATALSFSFPTLYFLDQSFFNQWLSTPFHFCTALTILAFVGSLLGFAVAYHSKKQLLETEQLAFPLGQLVFKLVDAGNSKEQKQQLFGGVLAAAGYALLQTKLFFGKQIIPNLITVWNKKTFSYFMFPALRFDLTIMPMLLSVGFLAGHLFAVPLLVGTALNIFVAEPVNLFFFQLPPEDFMFALCSGMVLSGAFAGILTFGGQIINAIKNIGFTNKNSKSLKKYVSVSWLLTGITTVVGLSFFKFSFVAQMYSVVGTVLCAYQIARIAGKIGLALLGRFATFVMIPGLLLFGFDPLQITVISTLVELAGGVAAETLFGLKTAQLAHLDEDTVYWYQLFGVVVASITAAIVLYYLFITFQLGSSQLFAQRAQARALLVKAASFNYYVLALGIAVGMGLKKLKINPTLVLGGLLMPLSLSLSLIAGGLLSFMIKQKEQYEPLCSGMYATNALTVLLKILI